MQYRTVSFQLLSPSAHKRGILDSAFDRYARAFQVLLQEWQKKDLSGISGKAGLLKTMDKGMLAPLKPYGVEPFMDALKLDAAMTLSTYLGRKKAGLPRSFPVSRIGEEELRQGVSAAKTERELDWLYDKFEKERPVFFCRYANHRDYSLLLDRDTGRYYAKLYLFNLQQAAPPLGEEHQHGNFVCVGGGEPPAREKRKRRYALFPLCVGEHQADALRSIEDGSVHPKSAQLIRKGKKYFLQVRLARENVRPRRHTYYLGVSRGLSSELSWSICDKDGGERFSGLLDSGEEQGKNRLHRLANEVLSLAELHNCSVIMENLHGRGDRLETADALPPLLASDYRQVAALVQDKGARSGIGCVLVSPSAIFYRCGRCGGYRKKNRMGGELFLCVSCGASDRIEHLGAENLARALVDYNNTKILVECHADAEQVTFTCPLLMMSFTCPKDRYANERFYDYIKAYDWSGGISKTQRSIMIRLGLSSDWSNVFLFQMK